MANIGRLTTFNSVQLKGRSLGVSLKDVSPILQFSAEKFLKQKMEQIKQKAQSNLKKNNSVRFGDLRDAIETKAYVSKDGYVWSGVGIDRDFRGHKHTLKKGKRKGNTTQQTPVKYSHFVERGFTHLPDGTKIEGKPFLMPAVNQCGGDDGIAQDLTDNLKHTLKKELQQ